ncbi:MAG: hypothetical protein NT053_05805 [Cyanobacteria bacterium]|nr:hypothetical protein [Cyanobacteriota bacterium]
MPPDAPYAPPLTLTPELLNRVAAIAEALGRWSARQDSQPSPRLRRENRIHTTQASLAIEQNSLSIEQVGALFDGQRVLGPARDIQEVRNAITAYDALPRWDPVNHPRCPAFGDEFGDPFGDEFGDRLGDSCEAWRGHRSGAGAGHRPADPGGSRNRTHPLGPPPCRTAAAQS